MKGEIRPRRTLGYYRNNSGEKKSENGEKMSEVGFQRSIPGNNDLSAVSIFERVPK